MGSYILRKGKEQMKERRLLWTAFVLVLVGLFLFGYSEREPQREVLQPDMTKPDQYPVQQAGGIERKPALEQDPAQPSLTVLSKCVLVSESDRQEIKFNGTGTLALAFPDGTSILEEQPVIDGVFMVSKSAFDALVEGNVEDWMFSIYGTGTAHSVALEYFGRTVNDIMEICFLMPARHTIRVTVANLNGIPIEGASVECDTRTGWAHSGKSGILTDPLGIAILQVFSGDSRVFLRVMSPGYITRTAVVERGVSEVEVALRRLLAACVVLPERVILSSQSTSNLSGGVLLSIRPADYEPLFRQIEAGTLIDEGEVIEWSFFGEAAWTQAPRLTIDYSGWFGGYYGSLELDLKQVTDPDFAIARIPEGILTQAPILHEVLFHFGPVEQFLAEPPNRIQLKVVPSNPDQSLSRPFDQDASARFVISPRRITGTTYRAFLPAGSFLLTEFGWDWTDRMPHRDPRLMKDTPFAVSQSAGPVEVSVLLHPDEKFVVQRFVDYFGRELDLEAILLPEDSAMPSPMIGFIPTSGHGSIGRFVRPGYYTVWLYDHAHMGSIRYPRRVYWSTEVDSSGHWDVPVDMKLFEQSLIAR